MADGTNDLGFFGFARKAFGWTSAALGFVAGLVSFVKLVSGDARLVFYIVLVLGGLLLWGSCFYIYFLKKKARMRPGVTSDLPSKKPVFPDRARKIARAGIFVVPILALVGFAARLYYAYRAPDKIIVTVANFQSLDPSISATTERLISKLKEATKPYRSQIEIDSLGKSITEQDGGSDAAQSIGRDRKSTIVIWGWDNKDTIRAYFEVLISNRNYLSVLGTSQPMDLIVAGHETFRVQMNLSEDMAYLTLLAVGLARYESQDYEGAVRLLRDALSHTNSQSSEMDNNKKARLAIGYFYLGRALADQGNYDEARVNYLEALKYKTDYEAAHLHLGYVYQAVGDEEAAKREFDQVIQLCTALIGSNPRNVEAYNNRGSAYADRGDLEKALQDYDQATKLDPKNVRAFNNRGLIFYKKAIAGMSADESAQDMNRALQDFNHAVYLSPDDASTYNNRGAAYSNLGRFKEALDDYDKVIKFRPNNSLSYLSRAFVYFDKRDYPSAIQDYDRAIQLSPGNFRAYRNRAWAHFFSAQYAEAASDAQKFLDLRQPCNNNKDYMYVAILGYVSLQKSSLPGPARELLDKSVAECGPSTKWQYSLLNFLHHDITAEQLLAVAGANNDLLTDAHAYIGMDLFFSGHRSEALQHLQWVRDHGNREFDEYHLALAEISRLAPGPGD